jgi:molybdenum cofactor synthesis domain-containing protein
MVLRFGILTVSDRSSRGERDDESGPSLAQRIEQHGWKVNRYQVVPDEPQVISEMLEKWADSGEFDVILTTGGTGFSPRDVTPEATQAVIQRSAPGLAEAMRIESLKITPHAMLSRGIAGIRSRTLIVNLPGSPKAALENFDVFKPVVSHAVSLLRDDKHAEGGHQFRNGI